LNDFIRYFILIIKEENPTPTHPEGNSRFAAFSAQGFLTLKTTNYEMQKPQ